ncbi:MAG: YdcF family protein [Clostridia bacterium]|nr:YdcF family protein [Clostridia bacterium]
MMKNKKERIINIITVIFAVFILLNYSVYLFCTVSNGGKTWNALVAVGIIMITLIPLVLLFLFEKEIPRKYKKLIKVLKTVYIIGMGVYVLSYSVFAVWVTSGVSYSTEKDYNCVIVFGGGVKDGKLSRYGENRLNAIIPYLEEHENTAVIVSGGVGEHETFSEADVMAEYFMQHGISGERIILEDQAKNTWENIEYSFDIIGKKNTALGISSDYHVKRIELMAKEQNVDLDMIASKSELELNTISSYVREYMAYFKYFLGLNDI